MTEILYNLIDTYITPILHFSSCYIDENGYIKPESEPNSIYKFENKKYNPMDINSPRYFIPVVIKNDSEYLSVKNNNNLEIFNPFTNLKHMNLLAILVKQKLTEYYNSDIDEDLIEDDDYDDNNEELISPDELISFYSINEPNGELTLVFSKNKFNKKTVEIARVTGTDQIYLTWLLCIKAMDTCINNMPESLLNPEKEWLKIMNDIEEWNKNRKFISHNVSESKEIDSMFEDFEDIDIQDPSIEEFVEEDDIIDYMFNKYGKNINSNNYNEKDFSEADEELDIDLINDYYYDNVDF